MTLELQFFNIWAVLVGIVSNMAIGALWYSPVLFGNAWLTLVGKKSEDISDAEGSAAMALSIIPAIVTVISLALLLGFTGASSISDALVVGSLASLGLMGMGSLNLVFFEDRSIKLTALNAGYFIVALNVAAVILTLWK